MAEFPKYYNNPEPLRDPDSQSLLFNDEEDLVYHKGIYSSIENCITIYREESINQNIPNEVHVRLHKVIKKQWLTFYKNDKKIED